MAKKKIKEVVAEILNDYLIEESLELWNVEFAKEVKDWFLRVYIDKVEPKEGEYIGIDDCEKVSRFLSEKLDEEDLIEQNYYLEVSSPGMDRELITEEHYRRYIGELVDIKLYAPINGSKNIVCQLMDNNEEAIKVKFEDNNKIDIPKKQIAKTRLAVVF
ncbi:MAG: ribosome maturation factor RimP [Anaerovoracaceae bacterium]